MADWWASEETARGYQITADLPPGKQLAVTLRERRISIDGGAHQRYWHLHSYLIVVFPASAADVIRQVAHWAGFYDTDLPGLLAGLATKLAEIPEAAPTPSPAPIPSGAN